MTDTGDTKRSRARLPRARAALQHSVAIKWRAAALLAVAAWQQGTPTAHAAKSGWLPVKQHASLVTCPSAQCPCTAPQPTQPHKTPAPGSTPYPPLPSAMPHGLVGALLGMGNPLLDISAVVDPEFLEKYDVSGKRRRMGRLAWSPAAAACARRVHHKLARY